MALIFQLAIVSGSMIGLFAEWRIHKKNLYFLKNEGAKELEATLSRLFYSLILISPILLLLEGRQAQSKDWSSLHTFVLGLIAVSSVIRWWAIDSLRSLWTMGCFVHPRLRHWSVGPYRWCSHPEYITRVLEVGCYAVFFEAKYAGIALGCLVLGLALRLMMVEQKSYQSPFRETSLNQT